MTKLHMILLVLLVILSISYIICWLQIIDNNKSLNNIVSRGSREIESYSGSDFESSLHESNRNMMMFQAIIMFISTFVLAIFDSKYYVGGAMVTAMASVAHYYFVPQIKK